MKPTLLNRKRQLRIVLFAIMAFACILNSCKKEIISSTFDEKPKTWSLDTITYAQFLGSINLDKTGSLKASLTSNSKEKKAEVNKNGSPQLELDMGTVKKLTIKGAISYVIPFKKATPHAIQFQNLTVHIKDGKTTAFITTYVPDKAWIEQWRKGIRTDSVFRGETYSVTIDLATVARISGLSSTEKSGTKSTSSNTTSENPNSFYINGNKLAYMVEKCYDFPVYEVVYFPCRDGHYTGYCNYYDTYGTWETVPGDYPPSQGLRFARMSRECAFVDNGSPGGGGGGGGTTPNPPPGYDPCDCDGPPPPPNISRTNSPTNRLAVIPLPNCCDDNPPPPVTPTTTSADYLINMLMITDISKQNFLRINLVFSDAIRDYLARQADASYGQGFAGWLIDKKYSNPAFVWQEYLQQTAFDGINSPPTTTPNQEQAISNAIGITEIPVGAPTQTPRQIGVVPKRHSNFPGANVPEDLTFGFNGDMSDIYPEMVAKSDLTLLASMRTLLWQCSILSPDMRAVSSLMADRFAMNTGGVFENPTLTAYAGRAVQFQNFLKVFGQRLSNSLTVTNGDISNIPQIDMTDERPIFNGIWNKFAGLQICVNDIESANIKLLNFNTNSGVLWEADIEVTIYDNFGLDKHDAVKYQSAHDGFASWYILQHGRGHQPFQTKIVIKRRISGRY